MPNSDKPKTSTWKWVILGFFVAAVAIAVLFYIGWFDQRTHVDSIEGDNVEATYAPADSDSEAEAVWENAEHKPLDEVIVDD